MGMLDICIAQALSRIKEAPTKVEAALRPTEEALQAIVAELKDMQARGEAVEKDRETIISAAREKAAVIVATGEARGREIARKVEAFGASVDSTLKNIANG